MNKMSKRVTESMLSKINKILQISDSYQAPEKIINTLKDEKKRREKRSLCQSRCCSKKVKQANGTAGNDPGCLHQPGEGNGQAAGGKGPSDQRLRD